MSQYKVGTATVNKGSAIVTGSGTSWLANVNLGDGFTIAGTGVPYAVGSVDSDTQITLSEAYAGSDQAGVAYAIWRDFTTSHGIPELSQGDIETATIFTRAIRLIDGAILKVGNLSLQGTVGVYGSVSAGETATVSGEYFFVETGGNELKLYRNDSGSGTLVGTYPLLEDIQAEFDAKLVELQAQQDAFQANHVRLSRSLSKLPDLGETLRLDFATNGYGVGSDLAGMDQAVSLLDLMTFTRADPGAYYDPAGILKFAVVDEPRLAYDPGTGEALGLSINRDRENLWSWSEAFDNPAWGKSRSTVTPDQATAPDGNVTADFFADSTDSGTHYLFRDTSVISGQAYVQSFFVEPQAYSQAGLRFSSLNSAFSETATIIYDLSGPGAVLSVPAGVTADIQKLPDGRYRIWASQAAAASVTGRFEVYLAQAGTPSFVGDGSSGIYIWGGQLEVGEYPTSYMKNEGSSGAVSADNASIITASSWFNSDKGTVYVEWYNENPDGRPLALASGVQERVGIMDNAGNISILWFSGAGSTQYLSLGVSTESTLGQLNRCAFTFEYGRITASLNGAAAVTVGPTNPVVPAISYIDIGQHSDVADTHIDGYVGDARYIPKILSAAKLQEITAP